MHAGSAWHNDAVTNTHWRVALWILMVAIVVLVVWQARFALFPFVIGAVLAYAATPIVDQLARIVPVSTHRGDVWRRGFVVLFLYAVFFGGIAAAGFALVPLAVQQTEQFINNLPEMVEEARLQIVSWIDEYQRRVPLDVQTRVETFAEGASDSLANSIASAAQGMIGAITGTLAIIFGIVIVPFFMFYAMRDRHFVANNVLNAFPPALREDALNVGRMADFMLGRYIRAQLLLAVMVGTAVGIGLTLMGVQMSLALALWAGLTELIPIIGPWLGAIPALIIVAATQPEIILWVALLYLGIQAAENYLLVPRLQSHAVDIHPAMVLVLLAIAGAIWGILGMLVVIPIAAIMREFFWYADSRLSGHTPSEAFSFSHLGQRQRDRPLDARIDEVPPEEQRPAEDPLAEPRPGEAVEPERRG